ncbi:MAG: prefoldin subunit alpha [Candidatus Diapherotrites archaeon]|uniref:Prefoldin subunit alpha n=1 Tax=Candidatus Iainarchaeum sp. TaxID=3101447 RepID=A0A8T4L4L5_9ARCH|nr:prefoldin subunit alpha [Candidatus Diapherotrites archaeon]
MATEEKEKEITLTGNQVAGMLEREKSQLNSLNQQLGQLQQITGELKASAEALKEIGKEKNLKILVPLGSGVMVEAELENTETVKLSLPGNIIANRKREDAIKHLEKQAEEAGKQFEGLQKQFQQTATNVNNLSQLIQAAQKKAQEQKL